MWGIISLEADVGDGEEHHESEHLSVWEALKELLSTRLVVPLAIGVSLQVSIWHEDVRVVFLRRQRGVGLKGGGFHQGAMVEGKGWEGRGWGFACRRAVPLALDVCLQVCMRVWAWCS